MYAKNLMFMKIGRNRQEKIFMKTFNPISFIVYHFNYVIKGRKQKICYSSFLLPQLEENNIFTCPQRINK